MDNNVRSHNAAKPSDVGGKVCDISPACGLHIIF